MTYTSTIQYASRRQGNWNRNQNTVAFTSAIKLGPISYIILISLAMMTLGMIYLTQATKVSGYDYASERISDKISSLSEEKQNLEVENARLTALQTVRSSQVAKSMTTPTNVQRVSE